MRRFSLLSIFSLLFVLVNAPARAEDPKLAAVSGLLQEARAYFTEGRHEQAAALLERALRIDPQNPVLWHNLAGVRLQQKNWERAISLAAKSNAFAQDDKWLRHRNWKVIEFSCEGMNNIKCAREARRRAHVLAYQ